MIEAIAMLTVLAGMGMYFMKSADLPQDLKDRSAQLRSELQSIPQKNKYAHLSNINKVETKTTSINEDVLKELVVKAEIQRHIERAAKLELINKEIDELTVIITTLEQEIRVNNKRNTEIAGKISAHLSRLEVLKSATIA